MCPVWLPVCSEMHQEQNLTKMQMNMASRHLSSFSKCFYIWQNGQGGEWYFQYAPDSTEFPGITWVTLVSEIHPLSYDVLECLLLRLFLLSSWSPIAPTLLDRSHEHTYISKYSPFKTITNSWLTLFHPHPFSWTILKNFPEVILFYPPIVNHLALKIEDHCKTRNY